MLKADRYTSYNLVYVLECENNCYYIGVSSNLNARLAQHFEGEGAAFTRKNKPIKLIEVHIGGEAKENEITEKYIEKYTLRKVSGGKYVNVNRNKISICYWLKSITL
jgi:putative endonuclease